MTMKDFKEANWLSETNKQHPLMIYSIYGHPGFQQPCTGEKPTAAFG